MDTLNALVELLNGLETKSVSRQIAVKSEQLPQQQKPPQPPPSLPLPIPSELKPSTTGPIISRKKYIKKIPKVKKLPIKKQLRKIKLAKSEGNKELCDQLTRELPKHKARSRAQTPISGLPRLNQKNKKKFKVHKQTDDAYDIKPQNVVCKFSTRPFDIGSLRYNWARAYYNPSQFPAASFGCSDPRCVISVYESGECGTVGTISEADGLIAATLMDYKRATDECDRMRLACFGAVNITTSFNFGFTLDVDAIFELFKDDPHLSVLHDPEKIGSVQIKQIDSEPSTSEQKQKQKQKHKKTQKHKSATRPSVINIWPTGRGCTVGSTTMAEWKSNELILNEIKTHCRIKEKRETVDINPSPTKRIKPNPS